jgi:hypothetical protein
MVASDPFDIRYISESETSETDISKDENPSNGMLTTHLSIACYPFILLFWQRN